MASIPITFDSPAALWTGLAIAVAAAGLVAYNRPALPVLTKVVGLLALLLLALAAGGPSWRREAREPVVVMVDLSPSTRGAQYRVPAVLRERLGQLLGNTPHRIIYFASGDGTASPVLTGIGEPLADLTVDRTTWSPIGAPAILLFTDARFEIPAVAPPTYMVVDPGLEETADAAVDRLELRGQELVVTVRNSRRIRQLIVARPAEPPIAQDEIPPAGAVIAQPIPSTSTSQITARLTPGDRWPENDALTFIPPPPAEAERWWVSDTGGTADGWRVWPPGDLPLEAPPYLGPSVIVLDNVAAADLGEAQLRRLGQYVSELGGGLVILGGDGAFAAGGYSGTVLDTLSPLASHPPEPSTHWVFVVDSSGSMNAALPGGGGTRWEAAVQAAARATASLPPHDPVSVGGFAAAVEWWQRGKAASEIAPESIPPQGARPSGPTELRRALESAAQGEAGGPPIELIVLTDANAPVEDPAALAALLRDRKVRLHLLDIGDAGGAGLDALRQIVTATGGTLLREADSAQWAAAVRRLTRAAAPNLLVREPARMTFTGPLAELPPRTVASPWNRTWIKSNATSIGTGDSDAGPLAASWNVGDGRVIAAAFGASPGDAEPFARLAARPPRDPGLRVSWDAGAALRVTVEATTTGLESAGDYLNGLPLTLEVRDDSAATRPAGVGGLTVPQVAPGRYELAVPAPRAPALATLRRERQVVDRVAVAGRFAPEFEAIGNDRSAMRDLAGRTGGAVVEPSFTGPLRLDFARSSVPLTSIFATAAATCLAVALIRWRRA